MRIEEKSRSKPSADSAHDGYFAPNSVSWQVHREVTVLFGGARALLLQAAHPLVVAGAADTGFYERNPWKRLERTLRLTYALTFGTREEADRAAARINEVHRRINGVDALTGLHYDALDPELLLWVHACLVDSAILFERYTVGSLDDAGRQRFHEEQMLAGEMLLLERQRIPASFQGLRSYMGSVIDSGIIQVGPAARRLASILHDWPEEAEWKPVLRAVSWWAFGTLPPAVREMYGVKWSVAKERALLANFAAVRALRPLVPAKYRFIEPYYAWLRAHSGHLGTAPNHPVPEGRIGGDSLNEGGRTTVNSVDAWRTTGHRPRREAP